MKRTQRKSAAEQGYYMAWDKYGNPVLGYRDNQGARKERKTIEQEFCKKMQVAHGKLPAWEL